MIRLPNLTQPYPLLSTISICTPDPLEFPVRILKCIPSMSIHKVYPRLTHATRQRARRDDGTTLLGESGKNFPMPLSELYCTYCTRTAVIRYSTNNLTTKVLYGLRIRHLLKAPTVYSILKPHDEAPGLLSFLHSFPFQKTLNPLHKSPLTTPSTSPPPFFFSRRALVAEPSLNPTHPIHNSRSPTHPTQPATPVNPISPPTIPSPVLVASYIKVTR